MTRRHFEYAARLLALRNASNKDIRGELDFAVALFSHFNDKFDAERFRNYIHSLRSRAEAITHVAD